MPFFKFTILRQQHIQNTSNTSATDIPNKKDQTKNRESIVELRCFFKAKMVSLSAWNHEVRILQNPSVSHLWIFLNPLQSAWSFWTKLILTASPGVALKFRNGVREGKGRFEYLKVGEFAGKPLAGMPSIFLACHCTLSEPKLGHNESSRSVLSKSKPAHVFHVSILKGHCPSLSESKLVRFSTSQISHWKNLCSQSQSQSSPTCHFSTKLPLSVKLAGWPRMSLR